MSNKNNERAEVRIMAEIKLVKGLPSKANRISR